MGQEISTRDMARTSWAIRNQPVRVSLRQEVFKTHLSAGVAPDDDNSKCSFVGSGRVRLPELILTPET